MLESACWPGGSEGSQIDGVEGGSTGAGMKQSSGQPIELVAWRSRISAWALRPVPDVLEAAVRTGGDTHGGAVVAGRFRCGGVGAVAISHPGLHDGSSEGHARRADHEHSLLPEFGEVGAAGQSAQQDEFWPGSSVVEPGWLGGSRGRGGKSWA